MSSRFVGVGALAASVALLTSGCWVQVGFDAGRTGFNPGETTVNAATVAGLEPAWTAPVGTFPGEVIAFGNSVFVRSSGAAQAVDARTGSPLWTNSAVPGDSGMAAAGNRLWVPAPGGTCSLQGLNMSTGAQVDGSGAGGPDLSGIGGFSACGMLDALTVGSKVVTTWSYLGSALFPRGCFPEQTNAAGGGLLAVDVEGAPGWSTGSLTTTCGSTLPPFPPGHNVAPMLSSDGTFVLELFGNILTVRTASTGACPATGCAFMLPLPPSTGGYIETPTLGADRRMVVVSRDGHVNVVDLTNNTLAWTGSFTTLAAVPAAVTPTTIYVAGENGELAAFPLAGCGAATCAPTWTATLPGRPTDRPTVGGDVVYVGTPSGVQAFAAAGCGAATCTPIWDQPTSAPVTGSPVVHNATVYVGTQDGTLTAYRLP